MYEVIIGKGVFMGKKRQIILVIIMIFLGSFKGFGGEVDYRDEMRRLIGYIGDKLPEEMIVIQQNAVDLYYKDGELMEEWLLGIDGISQESIYYGNPEYNSRSPQDYRNLLEKRLKEVRGEGLSVFTTNYTKTLWNSWTSDREAKKAGFVNYNVPNREVSQINSKIPYENTEDIEELKDVKNFLYLLNPERYRSKREYVDTLAKTNFDLLVIDAFFKGKPLSVKDIERIRYKRNGGRRLVISYLSIGEAEDYRHYWKKRWSDNPPEWLGEENPRWEGNYVVKYWHKEWYRIIEEYIDRIDEAGFDGVFLDTVDTYYYYINYD